MDGIGDAIVVTINLAAVTTLCLIVIATPIAWWLSRRTSPVRCLSSSTTPTRTKSRTSAACTGPPGHSAAVVP